MYILDEESDKKLTNVTIIFNKSELKELMGYAKQLLEETPSSDHYHLSSEDFQKEITLCIYDSENLKMFTPRIRKLIEFDE